MPAAIIAIIGLGATAVSGANTGEDPESHKPVHETTTDS